MGWHHVGIPAAATAAGGTFFAISTDDDYGGFTLVPDCAAVTDAATAACAALAAAATSTGATSTSGATSAADTACIRSVGRACS